MRTGWSFYGLTWGVTSVAVSAIVGLDMVIKG